VESAALATPAHGSYDPTFAKDGRMDGLEGRPWMADVDPHSDSGFRLERLANGWWVGRFAALEAIGVAHLVTTREGPDVQHVRHEPASAGREIARVLDLGEAAFLEQVHGGEVVVCETGGCVGYADGLVTATRGLTLIGKSGDCPIIFLADRGGRAVGFAHASWRATVAGIAPAAVRRMIELGCAPGELVACVCPSVGPCCYEVGEEVQRAAVDRIGRGAHAFFRPGPSGKLHFDLWRANTEALLGAGLAPASIHVAGVCTVCRNDLFPSHRREDDRAGRFAAALGRTVRVR
jgi:YfiH family protein